MGKESNPVLYNTKLASITTTGRRQFDILGTSYRTIKDAYSKHPQNVANGILQKQVERFGSHLNMSLYFDGPQAVEKPNTAKTREAGRHKALDALSTSMDTFESRMEVVLRIKKHHFITIKKNLASLLELLAGRLPERLTSTVGGTDYYLLAHQERPDYLHPVAKDGSLPWKAKRDDGSSSSLTSSGTTNTVTTSGSTSSTASNSAADSANPTKGRRKKTVSASSVGEQRPEKA
ncbi:hypothetical protein BGZ97_002906, partial [Linnemannia gamsii]